ncbi:MAG: hypothetical protein K5840_08290 [Eubacterium sp.]|nr:hypothetical protein [Eubacterium sp.]
MKKNFGRIVKSVFTLALAAVVMLTSTYIGGKVDAQAATTRKITIYTGEVFQFTDYSTVKSVKSSKKKVVKAKKSDSTHVKITAKKKGKSTVKIKTAEGTYKYKVKVKSSSATYSASLVRDESGYIYAALKSKVSTCFDTVYYRVTLKDSSGNVLLSSTGYQYAGTGKATIYDAVSGSYSYKDVDLSKSSIKVVSVDHNPYYTYKKVSSKLSTNMVYSSSDSYSTKYNLTVTNPTGKPVYGQATVFFYDSSNNIIGYKPVYIYVSANSTSTVSSVYIDSYSYPSYDHYKVVVSGFTKTYKY